jgi:FMN reductase [NAD(P)H]
VDTFLAIASKRDWRSFADRPIPEDVERRILEAGRIASSANNRQHRRFVVFADPELKERVAQTVYYAPNVQTAALAIAVVTPPGEMPAFDAGRAVEAMFLAAWNEGVVSVPNGMPDRDATSAVLGLGDDEIVRIVLAFGYPARPRDPEGRSSEDWLAEANRLAFDEIVERR